jgi:hypothetical protein
VGAVSLCSGVARRLFPGIDSLVMSTTEIIAQLPTLTPADREKVRAQLDAIDAAAPLSPEEKRLIDRRVAAYRQNPDAAVSWAVAEEEIRRKIGL